SATHVAASAGKSMGNCVATGHAAGIAAAMAAKKGCTPRELKVAQIQQALRADGVDLDRGGQSQDKLKNIG
ncbi:MAG: FAD-dependent oxidoreductase, partial [Planctomycetota bacterium]